MVDFRGRNGPQLGRSLFKYRAASAEDDDPLTSPRKCFRRGPADPGSAAGDDDCPRCVLRYFDVQSI